MMKNFSAVDLGLDCPKICIDECRCIEGLLQVHQKTEMTETIVVSGTQHHVLGC